MPNSRSDRLQLIGFALLLVAIAAANTLLDLASVAEGPWQMIGLAGSFAVGLVAMYTLKSPAAALAVLVVAFAIGALLMSLRLDRLAFHTLFPLLAYPLAAWAATWLIVREVMPRLPRERAHMAPAVGGLLLVLHLGAGFALLTSARGFLKMDEVPLIRDAAALAAAVPRGTNEDTYARRMGLFIEATVAPVPGGGLAAERDCAPPRQGWWRSGTRFRVRQETRGASWIDLILPDGSTLRADRARHIRNTWAWPITNAATQDCGLSEGDPVVIRAIPRHGGAGVELRDTTLIAYGSPEAFRTGYAPRADFAARQFGGVGFLLMLTGLIPLLAGVLHWLRARKG